MINIFFFFCPLSSAPSGSSRGVARGVRGRRTGPGRRGVSARGVGRSRRTAERSPPGSSSSEELDESSRQKRELLLSRRYNANEVPPSMNPVVVLRRLTVTVGGFRIELLPGPSMLAGFGSFSVDDIGQEGLVCVDAVSGSMNVEEIISANSSAVAETVRDPGAGAQAAAVSSSDGALDFGPYVNPNEVQNTNGALLPKSAAKVAATPVPKAAANQNDPPKPKTSKTQGKNDTTSQDSPTKHFKSKEAVSPSKPKPTVPSKSGSAVKGLNHPQLKKAPKGAVKHPAELKRKLQNNVALKRPGEQLKAGPGPGPGPGPLPKMPKIRQETPTKHPVKPGAAPRPDINKVQAPRPQASRPQHPPHHPPGSHPHGHPHPPSHPGAQSSPHKQAPVPQRKPVQSPSPVKKLEQSALKELAENEEREQREQQRLRKERILQKQRSRSARSVSVEEPELFIPDNAPPPPPLAKKDAAEEEPADGEPQWDPSKHCGLCKKPHNNR